MLERSKQDQIFNHELAVKEEQKRWKATIQTLQTELDREKNDKEAQKKWQNRFMTDLQPSQEFPAASSTMMEPPLTDLHVHVIARFAQSLALLPASQAPQIAKTGVLSFLVQLFQQQMGDVVTGSVLIAFVHLSIHSTKSHALQHSNESNRKLDIREQIVKAGVGTPLIHLLEHSQNARILVEAARLCAALATHGPNKRALASKNVVRWLVQHLMPRTTLQNQEKRIDNEVDDLLCKLEPLAFPWEATVQQNMLSALVNLSHDCDILRCQIAASPNFVSILVRYVRESPNAQVQLEAAKLLGNMAYNHEVNHSALMANEVAIALAACLTATSFQQSAKLARAGAIGLANLAYTSANQLAIGYSDASTFLLQLVVDAVKAPAVIEAAAIALACLCHQHPPNKARVAAQNGLQVLLYALRVLSNSKDKKIESGRVAALVALCESFAILVHSESNRQHALELDDHVFLFKLCSKTSTLNLLEASARAICAMILPLNEHDLFIDNRKSIMETTLIALKALKRARKILIQKDQDPLVRTESENAVMSGRLRWLTRTIDTLDTLFQSTPDTTAIVSLKVVESDVNDLLEFRDRNSFLVDTLTAIQPDDLCPHFYNG